jgi:hypothetical protein
MARQLPAPLVVVLPLLVQAEQRAPALLVLRLQHVLVAPLLLSLLPALAAALP